LPIPIIDSQQPGISNNSVSL